MQRPSSPAVQITTPDSPKPPPRPPPPNRASTLPKRNSSKEGEIIIDFANKSDEEAAKSSGKPKPAPRTKLSNNPSNEKEGAPVLPPKPKNPFHDDMDQNETEKSLVNSFDKSGAIQTEITSDPVKEEDKSTEASLDQKLTPSSPKAGKSPSVTKKAEKGNPPKVAIVSFLFSVQVQILKLALAFIIDLNALIFSIKTSEINNHKYIKLNIF